MRGRSVLFLAALAAPNAALAVDFPEKAGIVKFSTPSANVECTYVAKATANYTPRDGAPELSCDRANPKYVRVTIGGKDEALKRVDNPPDQPCCGADHILAYGQKWTGGPFTCESEKTGLTCRGPKGRGFFLGLKAIRAF
jgi:hypothetical protein